MSPAYVQKHLKMSSNKAFSFYLLIVVIGCSLVVYIEVQKYGLI